MKLNLPTWATTLLALIAGVLAVLNQTTFGFIAPWKADVTVALVFLSAIGIAPLVGSQFRNALHLTPAAALVIGAAVTALAAAVTTLPFDVATKGVIEGVLSFLAGIGFGPVPVPPAAVPPAVV